MGRPALPLGTMGDIRCYRLISGNVRAIAYYRDYDGVTRQVERVGRSEAQARSRLKEACRDRGRTDSASDITPDTTVAALAEAWFEEVDLAVRSGDRSPGTGRLYRDRIDNQIVPGMGGLRLREVSVSRVDRLLRTVRERHGVSVSKATRNVLSGMFGLAARHDAVASNPVRDAAPIRVPAKEKHALTLDQVRDLRVRLRADQRAVDWDLPDLVDMMLATGLRIGEACALTWPAIDFERGTVEVRGTVIRVAGEGLRIKPKPKSRAGWRVIELPSWGVDLLKRRRIELPENEWGIVFTSPSGKLRDPSNAQADLKSTFPRIGYGDITWHAFRRTVATLMDGAGLSARAAADQLGHAQVSMTTDHYFGRRVSATGAARVLEAVLDEGAPRDWGGSESHG